MKSPAFYMSLRAKRSNLSIVVLFIFMITGVIGPMPVYAKELTLPKPGVMVHLSPPMNPPLLKGIKVYTDNPFKFDFILDPGDSLVIASEAKQSQQEQLKTEANRLIKYFLASITVPEEDLWVNLSPYEKHRIIPDAFGKTEMGRDLLAQDYLLKQITASLIYPEEQVGKEFWTKIYKEAQAKFGTTNIPVNTFNKVWIVPAKAVVYENVIATGDSLPQGGEGKGGGKQSVAYVVEAKLKVMLEQDYLSLSKNSPPLEGGVRGGGDTSALGSQIVREIVLPQLEKEVNENKNFASLRQVYHSLILAAWYKQKIKRSILAKIYADKNKVKGVGYDTSVILSPEGTKDLNRLEDSSATPQNDDVNAIYQQYLQAFKKGVFNYIKEELAVIASPQGEAISTELIPRKYFSGGVELKFAPTMKSVAANTNLSSSLAMTSDPAMLPAINNSQAMIISANIISPAQAATNLGKQSAAMRAENAEQSQINAALDALIEQVEKKVRLSSQLLAPKEYARAIVNPTDQYNKGELSGFFSGLSAILKEIREPLVGKFVWPINTSAQPFYLANYFRFPTVYNRSHNTDGIAIQVAAGTPVLAVKKGRIIFEDVRERLNVFGSATVYIQTPENVLWAYENIDIKSIPKKFKKAMRQGKYHMSDRPELQEIESMEVAEGEFIGKVMAWDGTQLPTPKSIGRRVPKEVKNVFHDRYDHLYIWAYYNPNAEITSITNELLQQLRPLDPLPLFKLLGNFELPWEGSLKWVSLAGRKVYLNTYDNSKATPQEVAQVRQIDAIDPASTKYVMNDDYAMLVRSTEEMKDLAAVESAFQPLLGQVLATVPGVDQGNLINMTDAQWQGLKEGLIDQWRSVFVARPEGEVFLRLVEQVTSANATAHYRARLGKLNLSDLSSFYEYLHWVAVNYRSHGMRYESIGREVDFDTLIQQIPYSALSYMKLLEGAGLAGTAWEDVEPDSVALQMLSEGKYGEFMELLDGHSFKSLIPELKAAAQFYQIDIPVVYCKLFVDLVQRIYPGKSMDFYVNNILANLLAEIHYIFQGMQAVGLVGVKAKVLGRGADGIALLVDVPQKGKRVAKINIINITNATGVAAADDANRKSYPARYKQLTPIITGDPFWVKQIGSTNTMPIENGDRLLFVEVNEFVEGISLRDRLAQWYEQGRWQSILKAMRVIVSAHDRLRSKGYVNRDVANTSNMVVTDREEIRMIDLGNIEPYDATQDQRYKKEMIRFILRMLTGQVMTEIYNEDASWSYIRNLLPPQQLGLPGFVEELRRLYNAPNINFRQTMFSLSQELIPMDRAMNANLDKAVRERIVRESLEEVEKGEITKQINEIVSWLEAVRKQYVILAHQTTSPGEELIKGYFKLGGNDVQNTTVPYSKDKLSKAVKLMFLRKRLRDQDVDFNEFYFSADNPYGTGNLHLSSEGILLFGFPNGEIPGPRVGDWNEQVSDKAHGEWLGELKGDYGIPNRYVFGYVDCRGEALRLILNKNSLVAKQIGDSAQLTAPSAALKNRDEKGGIDLTSGKLPLEVKKQIASTSAKATADRSPSARNDNVDDFSAKGGPPPKADQPLVEASGWNIDPAMLQQLQNAPGFMPVIINIQPMTDLKVFLGVNNQEPKFSSTTVAAL